MSARFILRVLGSSCRKDLLRPGAAFELRKCLTMGHRSHPFSMSKRSAAALAQRPPAEPSVLVDSPSQSKLKELDLEIDLLPPEDVRMQVTDRAAEHLRNIALRKGNPDTALRIAVESGGCHGYQYKLELATEPQPDDYRLTHPTLKPCNIYIDAVSMSLLNGSTIDFATELIGSSFRIMDNPQAQGSGCGCGVSWELKI